MSEETPAKGGIGRQIYEQVERIVAADGITRSEAFQRLSDETGRKAGTVAANYYRIARAEGNVRPRAAGAAKPGRRPGRPRKNEATGDVEQAISAVTDAVAMLTQVVRRQERDLARLQQQSEQLAKLRKLLA